MVRFCCFILSIFWIGSVFSQNIGVSTQSPDPSAILDIESTDSGLLIPRLTTTQRNTIDLSESPQSTMIYNTTDECFQVYVDSDWRSIWCVDCTVSISTQPSGAYLDGGDTYTFSVEATGAISNYQWIKDNVNIPNATNSTFTINNAGATDAGNYKVKISGACDTVTSNTVAVSVWICGDTVMDYDANSYNTVVLGNQCWMSQNLKVLTYSNGVAIPFITLNTNWVALSHTDKACAYYDYDSNNESTYGVLYTWAAAMNGASSSSANPSGVQGPCPNGWHIPSNAEWIELEEHLGMSSTVSSNTGFRGDGIGSEMAGNASLWTSGSLKNHADFGTSGLDLIPGGRIDPTDGDAADLGENAVYWSSTASNASFTHTRLVWYADDRISNATSSREVGMSIRCVKD